MLMAGRVVRTKTEQALVRIARSGAWSGSLTTASLVSRSIDCGGDSLYPFTRRRIGPSAPLLGLQQLIRNTGELGRLAMLIK